MTILIVEIPHQMPAFAWIADDWSDAAGKATSTRDGQGPSLITHTLAELRDMSGLAPDGSEDPLDNEGFDIAREHGSAIEAQVGRDYYLWFAPDENPGLDWVVQEWICHDLNNAFFLESREDYERFMDVYTGHQAIGAKFEADKLAKWLGWADSEGEIEEE